VLLLTPTMHPKRPAWWIFTYLLPIIPFTAAWDGWVSHLRAYTPRELLQMTRDFSDSYGWEIRNIELQNGKFAVTCLIGLPRQRVESDHPRLAALTVSGLIPEGPAETVRQAKR